MGYLSADEIASMRSDILFTLPGTCVIQGVVEVSDGAGGVTPTWTPVTGGTVSCRHDPQMRRGQIEVIAGAEGAVFDSIFILPYNAPVAVGQRIIHNSLTYQIRDLATDQSWQLCQKVYVAYLSEE